MLHVLAVLDGAAEAYGRPVFVSARGLAVRSFTDEVNRRSEDNAMNTHPADYTLWYMGTFNEQSGEWRMLDKPEMVCRGSDVKEVV